MDNSVHIVVIPPDKTPPVWSTSFDRLHNEMAAWCKKLYGPQGGLWSSSVVHDRSVFYLQFTFQHREAAVLFELTHG